MLRPTRRAHTAPNLLFNGPRGSAGSAKESGGCKIVFRQGAGDRERSFSFLTVFGPQHESSGKALVGPVSGQSGNWICLSFVAVGPVPPRAGRGKAVYPAAPDVPFLIAGDGDRGDSHQQKKVYLPWFCPISYGLQSRWARFCYTVFFCCSF